MGKQRGYTLYELLQVGFLVVIPLGLFGWGWNIYKITQADFAHIGGMLVIRIIGVFIAPLGAVLGFF